MHIYIAKNGTETGPFSEEQLHEMLNGGLASPSDLAWRDGLPDWQPLHTLLGLRQLPPPRLFGNDHFSAPKSRLNLCSEKNNLNNDIKNQNLTSSENKKLTLVEKAFCALPLLMIAIGGAIGGLLGGVVYVLNSSIFNKDISKSKKYFYSGLVSLASILSYIVVIFLLAALFPGLFEKK